MGRKSRGVPRFRRPGALRQLLPPALTGLVVALIALLLIHGVVTDGGAAWEHSWLLSIHGRTTPPMRQGALAVSRLAYPAVVVAIVVVLSVWWLIYGSAWKAGVLVADAVVLAAVDGLAKPFFHRPRPDLFPHPVLTSAAFPSGDALFAVGFYGLIVWLAVATARSETRVLVWGLWLLVACAMGTGRLVLGVHWPTDVVAGYAAGAIVLCFMTVAARRVRGAGR